MPPTAVSFATTRPTAIPTASNFGFSYFNTIYTSADKLQARGPIIKVRSVEERALTECFMPHNSVPAVRLEVASGSSDKVQVIKVIGPLMMDNFLDFQALTRKKPFPPIMLVDLTNTPYIDSAALGSLVGLHVSCEASHRKYALINANEKVQILFEMTNVHSFLVHYGSVADAEAALC